MKPDNKFLMEILRGREERAFEINKLNKENEGTVICFTLNIPGPYKLEELYYFAFKDGVNSLEKLLNTKPIKEKAPLSGYEAYFISYKNIKDIKALAISLEEIHPLGRFFDIDIFYKDLRKISREDLGAPKRKCFLCEEDAVICSRSRKHSVDELITNIKAKINSYMKNLNEH